MVASAPIRAPPLRVIVTPRSSAIFLMLTTRFGVTMKSFINASRSVPPAMTSVSPHCLPSSSIACSLVVGLAYSNFCIGFASFLSQRRQDAVGGKRDGRNAHADGVGNGVRDRCARRNRRRFADADHAAFI